MEVGDPKCGKQGGGDRDRGADLALYLEVVEGEAAIRSRANMVLAQLTRLAVASRELPSNTKPFADRFEDVAALQTYLVPRIERMLVGLGRPCVGGSRAATMVLRRVAVGNAEFGFAMLGDERRLACALAAGTQVPSPRFAMACRTLRLALGQLGSEGGAALLDLPRLTACGATDVRNRDAS